jgi:hypothetical protein
VNKFKLLQADAAVQEIEKLEKEIPDHLRERLFDKFDAEDRKKEKIRQEKDRVRCYSYRLDKIATEKEIQNQEKKILMLIEKKITPKMKTTETKYIESTQDPIVERPIVMDIEKFEGLNMGNILMKIRERWETEKKLEERRMKIEKSQIEEEISDLRKQFLWVNDQRRKLIKNLKKENKYLFGDERRLKEICDKYMDKSENSFEKRMLWRFGSKENWREISRNIRSNNVCKRRFNHLTRKIGKIKTPTEAESLTPIMMKKNLVIERIKDKYDPKKIDPGKNAIPKIGKEKKEKDHFR